MKTKNKLSKWCKNTLMSLLFKTAYCCSLLVLFAAFSACSEKQGDDDNGLTLSIDKTAIDAHYVTDAHTIAVTSSSPWTAFVSSGFAWCTLTPSSATGNSTVTVNVEASASTATRTAAIVFTAGTLSQKVSVTQAGRATPLHAASTQTWTFGPQIWSDAIHFPDCDKTSFLMEYYNPQCRSRHTEAGTWYYYNWTCADLYADALCPSPWRIPSREDFEVLGENIEGTALARAWGSYGGNVYVGNDEPDKEFLNDDSGVYWSSTPYSNYQISGSASGAAYCFMYKEDGYYYPSRTVDKSMTGLLVKSGGFQIRCVK